MTDDLKSSNEYERGYHDAYRQGALRATELQDEVGRLTLELAEARAVNEQIRALIHRRGRLKRLIWFHQENRRMNRELVVLRRRIAEWASRIGCQESKNWFIRQEMIKEAEAGT